MFQLLPPKGGFCFEYTFIGVRGMIQTNQLVVMIPVKRFLWASGVLLIGLDLGGCNHPTDE